MEHLQNSLEYYFRFKNRISPKIQAVDLNDNIVDWMCSILDKGKNDTLAVEFLHCFLSNNSSIIKLFHKLQNYFKDSQPSSFFTKILQDRYEIGSDQVKKNILDDFIILSIISGKQLDYFPKIVYRNEYSNKLIVSSNKVFNDSVLEIFYKNKHLFEPELISKLKVNIPLDIFSGISREVHNVDEITSNLDEQIQKRSSIFGEYGYLEKNGIKKTSNFQYDNKAIFFDKISKHCPEPYNRLYGEKLFKSCLSDPLSILQLWRTEHSFIRSFYPKNLDELNELYKDRKDLNLIYWAPILSLHLDDTYLNNNIAKDNIKEICSEFLSRDSVSLYEFELIKKHYVKNHDLHHVVSAFSKLPLEHRKDLFDNSNIAFYVIHYISKNSKKIENLKIDILSKIFEIFDNDKVNTVLDLNYSYEVLLEKLFEDKYSEYINCLNSVKALYDDFDDVNICTLFQTSAKSQNNLDFDSF